MVQKLWHKNYDPGLPYHLDLPEIPANRLLEDRAAAMPGGTACTLLGRTHTYRDINQKANLLAHALLDWGLNPGDRVALILVNSPAFISCQYGILKAGGTVVPVNPLYTGREMSHILSDCGARLAVVHSRFAGHVAAIMNQTKLEKLIVAPTAGQEAPLPEGAVLLEDFTAGRPEENPDLDLDPLDPALILYTGGTTGSPKGAVLHHRSQVYGAHLYRFLGQQLIAQKDSFLLVNPMFHIVGNNLVTHCLDSGLPLHLLPQYDPGLLLRTIEQMKPTRLPGPPTMFIGLMNHPDLKNYNLSSLRYCISGAAPFPVEPMLQFEKITGCRVVETFGMTETGIAVFFNSFIRERKIGSIGYPMADIDARIMDLQTGTREMPVGEEGELVIQGPPIMKHYLNLPEETENALRDGWLFTGDIARMDEDGFFWVVDRKKDMIMASGFKVFPREIDEVLHEHPQIDLACAVGVPDPYRGETVKAFVVPKPGQTLTEEEVIEFCRRRLAAYKAPRMVEFRDSLPFSAAGKVLRKILREEELKKSKGR